MRRASKAGHSILEWWLFSKKFEFFNLHLTKDALTYMECIFEEKLKILQEMVDQEAGQFWYWLL